MRSILSELAKQEIRQAAQYIRSEFGTNRRKQFMQEIRHARSLIESNPSVGPVEPLLTDLPGAYSSYVMNRINKIIYRVDGNIIFIVDFWDVRRAPESLVSQVK